MREIPNKQIPKSKGFGFAKFSDSAMAEQVLEFEHWNFVWCGSSVGRAKD
jgi:RNA recognition motif-containing protein